MSFLFKIASFYGRTVKFQGCIGVITPGKPMFLAIYSGYNSINSIYNW